MFRIFSHTLRPNTPLEDVIKEVAAWDAKLPDRQKLAISPCEYVGAKIDQYKRLLLWEYYDGDVQIPKPIAHKIINRFLVKNRRDALSSRAFLIEKDIRQQLNASDLFRDGDLRYCRLLADAFNLWVRCHSYRGDGIDERLLHEWLTKHCRADAKLTSEQFVLFLGEVGRQGFDIEPTLSKLNQQHKSVLK